MKIAVRAIVCSFIIMMAVAGSAYAGGGGPHLWLSTDPNEFDKGGVGYTSNAKGWKDHSYIANSLPFTAYLYNAASSNKGTAYDIGLIIAVHKGETTGSITIADAFGAEQTLTYGDFTTINPYPGGKHGIDGVYAVLKPSSTINLTIDGTNHDNTTSTASSWTKFVVKSSSFSEVHFDAKSFGGCDVFYNPGSHDIDGFSCGGGTPATPEPASMALLSMGLVGFLVRRKQTINRQ